MLKRQFDFSKTLILLIWASHLCPVKGWKLIFWYVVAWDISSLKWYIMFDWILINDLKSTASRRHFHHFWRQNTATECNENSFFHKGYFWINLFNLIMVFCRIEFTMLLNFKQIFNMMIVDLMQELTGKVTNSCIHKRR